MTNRFYNRGAIGNYREGISGLPGVTELREHRIIGLVNSIHIVILAPGIRISDKESRLRIYFVDAGMFSS